MITTDYYGQPVRQQDKLRQFFRDNPDGSHVPGYLQPAVNQLFRHEFDADRLAHQVREYRPNIYELEKELEHECLAKSQRHEIRQRLAEYIETNAGTRIGFYEKWINRLYNARQTGAVGVAPDGRHITAWDEKVNCVRLCPDEAREECQRLTRKYAPEIYRLLKTNTSWRCYFAVYTVPNASPGRLIEVKREIYKQFSNLHRSTWGKEHLKGSFVIQEDPLSSAGDWNVHLNVIHVVQGRFDYSEVRRRWGSNVHIQQIEGTPEHIARAFLEAVKYAAKHVGEKSEDGHSKAPGMTQWPFERFDEWFMAGKGFRRSRGYGLLYNIEAEAEKGIDQEEIVWIGTMRYNVNAYEVHLKKSMSALFGVDLILADKFASRRLDNTPLVRNRAGSRPPDRP